MKPHTPIRQDMSKPLPPVEMVHSPYKAGPTPGGWFLICLRYAVCLAAGLLALIVSRACHGAVSDAFLDQVAAIESGGKANARGRHGELGLFQFTPIAWRHVDRLEGRRRPFTQALDPVIARARARLYFGWIHETLSRSTANGSLIYPHIEPTSLYAAYNVGVSRFLRRGASLSRCPLITQNSARRLANQ